MAAIKTSLVLFLFALIAISANLQMASALGLTCNVGANVQIAGGCLILDPFYCKQICQSKCPVDLKVGAYLCVLDLISVGVNGCSCCFISI
ncbi:hypothetical protein MKW94_012962 [Papaver nudicaule]|uniref:Uncharacterized protein n=1 Tax=Papaver nudicaule TaxID=74823 RepID=A0AA42B1T4_PAPNU|nr:hypothetical protein [Papaver nudicaule]MCL7048240.1 hypothetical protein [Papaver nudicaule]